MDMITLYCIGEYNTCPPTSSIKFGMFESISSIRFCLVFAKIIAADDGPCLQFVFESNIIVSLLHRSIEFAMKTNDSINWKMNIMTLHLYILMKIPFYFFYPVRVNTSHTDIHSIAVVQSGKSTDSDWRQQKSNS